MILLEVRREVQQNLAQLSALMTQCVDGNNWQEGNYRNGNDFVDYRRSNQSSRTVTASSKPITPKFPPKNNLQIDNELAQQEFENQILQVGRNQVLIFKVKYLSVTTRTSG